MGNKQEWIGTRSVARRPSVGNVLEARPTATAGQYGPSLDAISSQ
jgi:hypothetical protein